MAGEFINRRDNNPEVRGTLLPNNATPLERAVEQSTARLDRVPTPINDIYSPQRIPKHLLPWMAWQTAINDYNDDWPEDVRREVLSKSYIFHAHKGTKWAIEQALDLIHIKAKVEEWYQYGGTPYFFRMNMNGDNQTEDLSEQFFYDFFRTVYDKKNARSWLGELQIKHKIEKPLYTGAGARYRTHMIVPLYTPDYIYVSEIKLHSGMGARYRVNELVPAPSNKKLVSAHSQIRIYDAISKHEVKELKD